jgi:hypothetical protein
MHDELAAMAPKSSRSITPNRTTARCCITGFYIDSPKAVIEMMFFPACDFGVQVLYYSI